MFFSCFSGYVSALVFSSFSLRFWTDFWEAEPGGTPLLLQPASAKMLLAKFHLPEISPFSHRFYT